MKHISADNRNNIISLLKDGNSGRKIESITGISRSTINRLAVKEFPNCIVKKPGRLSKLTKRDKLYCIRQLTTGGLETAMQVRKALEKDVGVSVCTETIRRGLHEMGLRSFVKPKKSYLSPKNIKARLRWAKAHVDWTYDDWARVIWSDETKVDRFGSDGRYYSWKRDSEELQSRHVQQTFKHGGGNIKLWSCITVHGIGYIVKIDETLDKTLYENILKDDLIHTVNEYKINKQKMIFQHDNDPKHTAGNIKNWLAKQEFKVMEWPAQSPDLNPIENMWALLKQRLYRNYEQPPKGMNEHWERIHETWYKITKEECQKVIGTMHKRCKEVIKMKGHWINY
jgi:transposase